MPSLLDLPRELRDLIWNNIFSKDSYSLPQSAYEILRTNKQIRQELAPYLYNTVVFHLQRPYQALQWIHTIGLQNSSCIRRLVLTFSSIEAKVPGDDAADIWSSAFGCLPNLETLIYEYDPAKNDRYDSTNPIERHPALCSQFDEALSLNPKARNNGPSKYDDKDGILSSFSEFKRRPITHAVLAIDDTIPEILVVPFGKILQINTTNLPLEQNITGLPRGFLHDHHLHLCRTYLLTEAPQRPSVTLTYRCKPMTSSSSISPPTTDTHHLLPPPYLPVMLALLPHLLYLRLGCPSTNSNFLSYLPGTLQTLDVGFTDHDPERVAKNLRILHARCNQLFTFAIVVSPLHDNNDLPDGGRRVQSSDIPEEEEEDGGHGEGLVGDGDSGKRREWIPFWKALREIQATGVRVWEGEGPGFRTTSQRGRVADMVNRS
ncbi:MAG: hypothetical protein Q9179_006848 [Wetmoreana sp. 5 TL-2023]